MARPYWNENDRYRESNTGSGKCEYLLDYIESKGRANGLSAMEVSTAVSLSEGVDYHALIIYFDKLPDQFKKAFKTAYRQHIFKSKNKANALFEATKNVEITELGHAHLELLLKYYKGESDEDFSQINKPKQLEMLMGYLIDNLPEQN